MMLEREYLSGSYISQSEEITGSLSIEPFDSFLISEPFIDKKQCEHFFSKKLFYDTLSSKLVEDIIKGLNLDSMSWELSNDYSRNGHVHDYSKVVVSALYGKENENTRLMDIVVNGNYNSIYMKKVDIPYQEKPEIGSLKFMSKLSEKQIVNEDFDGWVYPDGRLLDKKRFSEAFKIFGTIYGESEDEEKTQFRIPKLDHFIKANPCLSTTEISGVKYFNNGVGVHQHTINKLATSKTISTDISVGVTYSAATGPYAHGGSESSGIQGKVTSTIKFEIQSPTLTDFVSNQSGIEKESHPKYNIIPVLMYVGGENR